MYYLYNFIFYLFLPFLFIRLWLKQNKTKAYQKFPQDGRWKERLGFISGFNFTVQPIWIHSVSVGEFIAVLPLVNLLLKQHSNIPIIITTTTQTGSDLVLKTLGNKVFHSYIPWDLPDVMARFYKKIKPRAALIMETEIWPNLLFQANKKAIPIFLINARMSDKSFKSYKKIAGFTQTMMTYFSHVCVQNKADLKRFIALGLLPRQISITGNIKFDLTINTDLIEKSKQMKKQLQWLNEGQQQIILMISSTHAGEDELMLNLYKQLKQNYPQLKLILVPRHPERFKQVLLLAKKILANKELAIKTSQQNNQRIIARTSITDSFINSKQKNTYDVLIGDSLGEMILYYSMADIVIMGGTFIEHGGHNILEPAILSKPIFYGDSMYNFATINSLFLAAKASVQVKNINELNEKLNVFLDNPQDLEQLGINAKQLMDKHSGSKEQIYEILKQFKIFD
ncbi:MAG: 3-deoxy-D-manno-octulosonic acid transferase [Pseudomonadota bacterium]